MDTSWRAVEDIHLGVEMHWIGLAAWDLPASAHAGRLRLGRLIRKIASGGAQNAQLIGLMPNNRMGW